MRLENVFKVTGHKVLPDQVCPKFGLIQKDHGVASIVEIFCFILSLPLEKSIRHPLSQ